MVSSGIVRDLNLMLLSTSHEIYNYVITTDTWCLVVVFGVEAQVHGHML